MSEDGPMTPAKSLTLAERVATVLPCQMVARGYDRCHPAAGYCCDRCHVEPAVLTLVESIARETREATVRECSLIYDTSLDDAHANRRLRALLTQPDGKRGEETV